MSPMPESAFLGRLHARVHADQIADVALQPLIERDDEIDDALLLAAAATSSIP
jgi:hypothetical protein